MIISIVESRFRECDLQICIANEKTGSAYVDFRIKRGVLAEGKAVEFLQVSRISFDGFGCLSLVSKQCVMADKEAESFQILIKNGELESEEGRDKAIAILKGFFKRFKDVMWVNALEKFELI